MIKKQLIFLLLCITQSVFAQNAIFYDKATIGSQCINVLCQDQNNYLWIGTRNGLRRFDGSQFVSYYHAKQDSTSLADNEIHSLYIDDENNLWIGTANGLQRYLPEKDSFQTVTLHTIKAKGRITGIFQRNTGEILCNVSDVGIFSVDIQTMVAHPVITESKLFHPPFVTCLFEDSRRQLWLGTDRQGIVRIDSTGQEEKIYPLNNMAVRNILEDYDRRVFMVTAQTVFLWDQGNDKLVPFPYSGKKKNIRFHSVVITANGDIMLGTYGQGITCIKRGDKKITDADGIQSSFININQAKVSSLFEDKQQNLWIGCLYQGFLMLPHKPLPFSFWNQPIMLSDMPGWLNALYCDKTDTMWCSVEDNGIYQLDCNGNISRHIYTDGVVFSMFEDSDGVFWVGINGKGLYSFNRKKGKLELEYPLQGDFSIRCITEDKHKNLYAAILGEGILQYHLPTGKYQLLSRKNPIKGENNITNYWIISILCDSEDRIWFGHFGNISCYDTRNERFLDLPFEPEIKSSSFYTIIEGKDHTIWMGTKNGLVHYNPQNNQYSVITTEQGLPDNVICGLVQDKHGNLWCSTIQGICHILVDGKQVINYYTGNGLQEKVYLEGRYTQSKKGKIYFGGNRGITSFNPDDIQLIKPDTPPIITDMYIRDQKVTMETRSGNKRVVDTELVHADCFNLSYMDNTFVFMVSTMDFRDAGNVLYEYRLEEFNENWNKTQPGENRIQYHHLAPGNYTLQIRACENGFHSPIRSVRIHVIPPWYLSTGAKIVYILLVICASYLLYTVYRRKKQEEISEMKLQFFINIAHEIRSPLTLILGPLEKLQRMQREPDVNKMLLTIKYNTGRILNLINQLLDVRKIDKGQMPILCEEVDIRSFVNELLLVFTEQARLKKISLETKFPEKLPTVWIDPNNFDKVLVNLLSNAFKYTPENGVICIEVKTGSNPKSSGLLQKYMEISISDTGKGVNEKELKKIFNRFYQGDGSHTMHSLGFGIGLNLCQLLVKLHHGIIFAENRTDTQGCRFVIHLPLGCKHLKKEEMVKVETGLVPHGVMADQYIPYHPSREKVKYRKTNYSVLVIDDDDELRSFLKDNLAAYYHVDVAIDGVEGRKKAITQQPDIIISDVIMPNMDGIQLLKELKKNANTSHIPIILLTSQVEFSNRIEGLVQGADGYLCKPFNMEELMVLITNLIANRVRLKGKYSGSQTQEGKIVPVELQGNDEALMERIMSIINENLSNPNLNVEMLTQEVGISRTHLHRRMKEMTGTAPSDFIRNLRLQQATVLLENKDLSITQIAYAVGFTSQTHFSSAFKKVYGLSPMEYAQSNRNR